jgi:hypothetical protein
VVSIWTICFNMKSSRFCPHVFHLILTIYIKSYYLISGRAMAQAVSRRPVIADVRVRSRLSPCGIYGGQSGTGTGFSPSTSYFLCQFYFTGAPLQEKTIREIIIFTTGLHSKPQGCGASVASAAGPSLQKNDLIGICNWVAVCFLWRMKWTN